MTKIEKMELLIKAMKGEVEIEASSVAFAKDSWFSLHWERDIAEFVVVTQRWSIEELLKDFIEIRVVQKLPLLTEEDCQFLFWCPSSWYITKSKQGLVHIHETKPVKNLLKENWFAEASINVYLPYHSYLNELSWYNEDCYTIGQLIDNAKGQKK